MNMEQKTFKVYKVRKSSIKIEEFEATGETKQFFNIKNERSGRIERTMKISSFEAYFKTKEEAAKWYTDITNKEIEMFERSILSKKKSLELFNQENKITQK